MDHERVASGNGRGRMPRAARFDDHELSPFTMLILSFSRVHHGPPLERGSRTRATLVLSHSIPEASALRQRAQLVSVLPHPSRPVRVSTCHARKACRWKLLTGSRFARALATARVD